ncbi:MAG: HEAT repeat domain-containing protein [Haloplanus sp.]
MSVPADIVRRKHACLAAGEQAAVETATHLVERLVAGESVDDYLADAIREIAEAYPAVVEAVLPRLETWVLAGMDRFEPRHRQSGVVLALDLVAIDPDAADRCTELLRLAIDHALGAEALESFLVTMGRANPQFVADNADRLTETKYEHETVVSSRGWALARAYRTDPAAFDPVVESLRDAVAGDSEDANDALRQLGRIGLVAPAAVAPAVPAVVAAVDPTDDSPSTVALEAVGLIAGTLHRSDSRYGTPWSAAADRPVDDTLEAALAHPRPDVVDAAVTAYTRAVAHDETRRERAASAFLDRLATADADESRAALLDGLERLVDQGPITVPGAVATLVETERGTTDGGQRRSILRTLGGVDESLGDRDAVDRTLIEGLTADSDRVRRAAVDGIASLLSQQSDQSPRLVDALVVATTDPESRVRDDAVEALAAVADDERVVGALRGRVDDHENSPTVAEVARARGAADVVEGLVDRFVAAFRSGEADAEPDDETRYSADSHLTDEQSNYLDALRTVAERDPDALLSHTDRIVDIMRADATPNSHGIAALLSSLAATDPTAVRPFTDAIERTLFCDARSADAGYLLDTLLAVGATDTALVARAVDAFDGKALAPAAARLGEQYPLFCLRILTRLKNRIQTDDGHFAVAWWIHDLADIGVADVRASVPTLDLCRDALDSDDDWVRWDGVEALAAIAARHPRRVDGDRQALVASLDDRNSDVSRWALQALEHVGGEAVESCVAPFTAHPHPEVREVAAETLARLDDPTTVGPAAAGTPEGAVWEFLLTGRAEADRVVDRDGAARERILATLVVAAHRADEGRRRRVRELLVALGEGDDAADLGAAFARRLSASAPVRRALAAYGIGVAAESASRPADHLGRLAALFEDDEPLVRRWALRSFGRLGAASPADAEPHVPAVGTLIDDADPVTRAYAVRALGRIADNDPDAIAAAVDSLVHCLSNPERSIRLFAARVLACAPPERVAEVRNAPSFVVALFDADDPRLTRHAAVLTVVLAAGDPACLHPHLDRLAEELTRTPVRHAVATVAAHDAEAVEPYESDIADAVNDGHTRRALAHLHSTHYPELLATELVERPATITDEHRTFVEFSVTAPRRAQRKAAVETGAKAVRTDAERADAVCRALVARLDDDDRTVRQNAAAAIGHLVANLDAPTDIDGLVETLLPPLLDCAGDEHWEVRSQSLRAVSVILDAAGAAVDDVAPVVDAAFDSLGDEHGWVRRRAASILGALPADARDAPAVADRVVAALDAADDYRVRGATLAVGEVAAADGDHEAALDALAGAFSASDPWVRRNAFESATTVVADLDDPAAVERLVASVPYDLRERVRAGLSDPNPLVRVEACRCLGYVGRAADRARLRARTDDSSTRVRDEAETAIERLDDRVAGADER